MKLHGFSCAAALLTSAVAVASGLPPGAVRVLDAVQRGENVSLVELYERGDNSFFYVMDRIAEGGKVWLDVAARLAPGADGAPGEELANALAVALSNAPAAVLSRLFDSILLDDICRGPWFVESTAEYRAVLEKTITAVSRIEDATLIGQRNACLRLLTNRLAEAVDEDDGG